MAGFVNRSTVAGLVLVTNMLGVLLYRASAKDALSVTPKAGFMLRRHFLPVLCAAAARAQDRLSAYMEGAHGTALAIDATSRRTLAVYAPEIAGRVPAPPGSTVKPFAIAALIETGRLRAGEQYRCPLQLEIEGRNLTCSHPADIGPVDARTAIAYSCNCFVARAAMRFERGEVERAFGRYGLLSRTAWVEDEIAGATSHADARLMALGEAGVLVTPAAVAMAYTRLATTGMRAWMAPVMGGLEDAVEFGTAQRARVAGLRVAGKTGSVRAADGAHIAWFAGFAPADRPKYVVAVMLQGRSGGGDAAPLAGRILEAAWRERW